MRFSNAKFFEECDINTPKFDSCLTKSFNDLRPLFKTGLPSLGVAPFDPHRSPYIEQRRGGSLLNYKLVLTNVSEYGWTQSEVTKTRLDKKRNRIVYSQYFPEKSLDGNYEFNGIFLGNNIISKGVWNLTLYDYSQTTTVTRVGKSGGRLKVRVEIDRIGDMQLHISNLLQGKKVLEGFLDSIINSAWQPGFAVIKPLINDLVSTAFTDIFNDSFRHFPLEEVIR
ncbi:uncharacterized protein LOC113370234 [Ctenocephalides felis]|uniref:uncharacterized protein LOC113370234 n=1 Tax=Ctenocephalides felis TaxID=7515 RepID=UPI000E6E355E|nr:uncharacterized protein LOC113370234 [Ctenocephalides felis]